MRGSERITKKRLWAAGIVLFGGLIVLAFFVLPKTMSSGYYRQLEIGMSLAEVQRLYGVEAEFEASYGEFSILYYRPPMRGFMDFTGSIDTGKYELGMEAGSVAELPEPYNFIVVAIRDGRLHAYTWIGETFAVVTVDGSFRGSKFSDVPESVFEGIAIDGQ